jgi:epoxyqueuosine reductase
MPNSMTDSEIRRAIAEHAKAEGFDVMRITPAREPEKASQHLSHYVEQGRHGSMEWMVRNAEKRADPQKLWPEANSIIMLAANYGPEGDVPAPPPLGKHGTISVYARNKDYHDTLKKRLKRIASHIVETFGGDVKVFIDTAPVMEKPLAQAAGIGWQGKHTNLISREYGSWLFLGSIFTTLELEPDEPERDHCGQCRRCLDACPTNAFPAPYQLDARRCISYLTIEYKDHIALEFREAIGSRIYGCDDCLAVCPWNKFAQRSTEAQFHAREDLESPALADLARLDDANFRALFSGSPIKRTGRNRFVRNVLIAIGNSGDADLAPEAAALLNDESPLVRAMAVWALSRLCSQEELRAYQANAQHETDAAVLSEWRNAIS